MEYKIVYSKDLPGLERRVNDLIQDGWRPHGGLIAVPASGNFGGVDQFAQAMTRHVSKD